MWIPWNAHFANKPIVQVTFDRLGGIQWKDALSSIAACSTVIQYKIASNYNNTA